MVVLPPGEGPVEMVTPERARRAAAKTTEAHRTIFKHYGQDEVSSKRADEETYR